MHKYLYVQCELEFRLIAESPILVQGAQDQEGDATFYKARDPAQNGRERYCIPASSLKGVWRNAAETILRTFDMRLACDPFADDPGPSQSCSKRLEAGDRGGSPAAYIKACPACRLFGSTAHAGLLLLQDVWADGNPQIETQTSTAIDRFTGGVKGGALFKYHPLRAGANFGGRLTITNPEFWHLGLLFLVAREMTDGKVRLGSGTRKGLGHVQITWQRAQFRYSRALYDQASNQNTQHEGVLAPLQALTNSVDRIDYPTAPEAWLLPGIDFQPANGWADAPWKTCLVDGANLEQLARDCVESALVPKLRLGPSGFVYAVPDRQEAPNA